MNTKNKYLKNNKPKMIFNQSFREQSDNFSNPQTRASSASPQKKTHQTNNIDATNNQNNPKKNTAYSIHHDVEEKFDELIQNVIEIASSNYETEFGRRAIIKANIKKFIRENFYLKRNVTNSYDINPVNIEKKYDILNKNFEDHQELMSQTVKSEKPFSEHLLNIKKKKKEYKEFIEKNGQVPDNFRVKDKSDDLIKKEKVRKNKLPDIFEDLKKTLLGKN